MAPHPTHRPDRLTRNECGRGDVSRPSDLNPRSESHSACEPFKFGRAPSRAIDETLVAETSPATRVAPTSIGAGAGKIADWSIAGRIGEGQPVPRFGGVVRSPATGLGSSAWSVTVWRVLSGALRFSACARAFGFSGMNPVPSHGANERLGQFLDTSAVLRARSCAITPVSVKFVRARLAGLPGLARIAVQRVGAALAGAVLQKFKLFVVALSHGSERIHEVSHASEKATRFRGIPSQGGRRV